MLAAFREMRENRLVAVAIDHGGVQQQHLVLEPKLRARRQSVGSI